MTSPSDLHVACAPDWSRIVLDLRRVCGSARNIARLMHYGNPDYLAKLARSEIETPPWTVGNDLIGLYHKHVREELPMLGAPQQRSKRR